MTVYNAAKRCVGNDDGIRIIVVVGGVEHYHTPYLHQLKEGGVEEGRRKWSV